MFSVSLSPHFVTRLPRPLADSEKLPVQKHRNADTSKSPEKEDVPVKERKIKKPKKKEKKHKEKEREKKKGKEEKVVRGPRRVPMLTFPPVCPPVWWSRQGRAGARTHGPVGRAAFSRAAVGTSEAACSNGE